MFIIENEANDDSKSRKKGEFIFQWWMMENLLMIRAKFN